MLYVIWLHLYAEAFRQLGKINYDQIVEITFFPRLYQGKLSQLIAENLLSKLNLCRKKRQPQSNRCQLKDETSYFVRIDMDLNY